MFCGKVTVRWRRVTFPHCAFSVFDVHWDLLAFHQNRQHALLCFPMQRVLLLFKINPNAPRNLIPTFFRKSHQILRQQHWFLNGGTLRKCAILTQKYQLVPFGLPGVLKTIVKHRFLGPGRQLCTFNLKVHFSHFPHFCAKSLVGQPAQHQAWGQGPGPVHGGRGVQPHATPPAPALQHARLFRKIGRGSGASPPPTHTKNM